MPVLRLKLKKPGLWWARWKISSCGSRHHPVCRGCKSGNRCIHGYRCLFRHADGNKETQSEVEKNKVLKDQFPILKEKKRPRLCISKLRSYEFYSTESWRVGIERFGGAHHEILGMHLEQKLNSEKKKAIWRHYPKRWTGDPRERNPGAPSFKKKYLTKPHDKQIVPAK